MSAARRLSRWVVGGGRLAVRALPDGVRRRLEDRFFYAVFQVTRVENDNYGRTADPDSGGSGKDEAARPLRRG